MAFCVNCGTPMASEARFCVSCGTPVGGIAAAPPPPPAAPPPPPPAAPPPPPATEKAGNIRKCPACGAEVPAMTAACPTCGHEFSNVQVSNSVQEFFARLTALEQQELESEMQQPQDLKSKFLKGALKGVGLSGGASAVDKSKIALIESFPVPNSKEDILEFVIMATSRIKKISKGASAMSGYMKLATLGIAKSESDIQKNYNEAWKVKCLQVWAKAQIAFSSDKEGLEQVQKLLKEAGIIE